MTYTGGKGGPGVAQQIINQLPPHGLYVEPFAGHAAVAAAKRAAPQTILADLDRTVVRHLCDQAAAGQLPPGAHILHTGAMTLLAGREWPADALIYCDPPYLYEARAGGYRPRYAHEFGSIGDHKRLLRLLKQLRCMVAISGYPHELYDRELGDWRVVEFVGPTRGGGRIERLWMNYPEPVELHDYRYLGSNFRERERLKRQRQRWQARLQEMPAQQRYALLAALDEVRATAPAPLPRYQVASPGATMGAPTARQEELHGLD